MKAVRYLLISLLCNALAIGYLFLPRNRAAEPTANRAGSKLPEGVIAAAHDDQPIRTGGAVCFQWAQVESDDYPRFIANLRSVGCPEQTIRDIITAEMDRLYQGKRAEQENRTKQAFTAPALIERENAKLQQEETDLIETFLGTRKPGDRRSTTGTLAASPAAASGANTSQDPVPAVVPAALADLAPDVALNEDQLQHVALLQRDFVKAVGGYNQNPNDPKYQQRWQEAQSRFDDLFRTLFGQDAFLKQQSEAQSQNDR